MRHSTKSYSEDLRQRVVEARLSGMSAREVSDLFSVSVGTIRNWVMRYLDDGSVLPKQRGGFKASKITDMDRFAAFVTANAHCTLTQLQAKWEDEVSLMCLSRALDRLGWTHKKRAQSTANVTLKSVKHS